VGTTIRGVWASISGAASSAWSAISTGASAAWQSVNGVLGTLQTSIAQAWESMKQAALDAGGKLMEALAEGIRTAAMAPVNAVRGALDKIGAMLPHSDAKVGPLSTLTASGFATLDTLSRGIAQAQALPAQAMGRAFAFGEHLPSLMPAPMAASVAPGAPVSRAFAPVAVMPGGAAQAAPTAAEPLRDLLEAILTELRAHGKQGSGDTVVTLDGREIARAVYKDLREQRVRSYQSWTP
jgi:hypothetical protein